MYVYINHRYSKTPRGAIWAKVAQNLSFEKGEKIHRKIVVFVKNFDV